MIILAADHGGFELKNQIKHYLIKNNYPVFDAGAYEFDSNDDYPDFAKSAIKKLLESSENKGIFICGSGAGICMAANRTKNIRAFAAQTQIDAILARKDEDANVLCLGARLTSYKTALNIIKAFLNSPFEGGRHIRRLSKF